MNYPCINMFNPFPKKPSFLRVCSTRLLKTRWEKKKQAISFFFPHCFLPIWRTFYHSHQIRYCRLQSFEVSKICCWDNKLIFPFNLLRKLDKSETVSEYTNLPLGPQNKYLLHSFSSSVTYKMICIE